VCDVEFGGCGELVGGDHRPLFVQQLPGSLLEELGGGPLVDVEVVVDVAVAEERTS
jgi:hypothetical protein